MGICCWVEDISGSRLRVDPDGLVMGRGMGCAFRSLDTRVSVRHAEIKLRDNGVFLIPRSQIPTVLNGRPIHTPRQLTDGDWISLAPGVLYRVVISITEGACWSIDGGIGPLSISYDDAEVQISPSCHLSVSVDGVLLLSSAAEVTINGQVLPHLRQARVLELKDTVVCQSGDRFEVVSGPSLTAPPAPWSVITPLLSRPPTSVALLEDGRLQLICEGQRCEVTLTDKAQGPVLASGAMLEVSAAALQVLREDFIRAGLDGFCMLDLRPGGVLLIQQSSTASRQDAGFSVATEQQWWVGLANGSRLWLDSGGVLVGRAPGCDVRFREPYVHRHHLLIRPLPVGVEVRRLGSNPCYINGALLKDRMILTESSQLVVVPGRRMWLHPTQRQVLGERWCRVRLGEQEVTLCGRTATIGGHPADDIHVPAWPAHAIQLYLLDAVVYFESLVPVTVAGCEVAAGQTHHLAAGDALSLLGQTLTLQAHSRSEPPRPRMVMLQPFQSAGRLLFRFDDHTQIRLCLLQPHYALIQLLLEGVVGSRLRGVTRTRSPGDISESELPRGASSLVDLRLELSGARRLSLNRLQSMLAELTSDFIRAGMDGEALLEIGESWCRLHLGESCSVTLYS